MFDDAYFISLGCDVLERAIEEYKRLVRTAADENWIETAKTTLDRDISRFKKDILVDERRRTKNQDLLERVNALTSGGME